MSSGEVIIRARGWGGESGVTAKLALANELGLFGIGVWNIMNFFPQLWVVFNLLYNLRKG